MLSTQRLTINDGTQRATPIHDTDMPTVVNQCHVVSGNLERYRVGYIQIVVGQGIVSFPANSKRELFDRQWVFGQGLSRSWRGPVQHNRALSDQEIGELQLRHQSDSGIILLQLRNNGTGFAESLKNRLEQLQGHLGIAVERL